VIDIKTIALCTALINLFLCVTLFVAWRVQKVYAGFGFWVLANVGVALGYIFLAFLRDSIPFLIAIASSNLSFALASWLRLEGLHQFFGEKRLWYPHFILIALVIVVLSYFADDFAMRTALICGVVAYYLLRMTWVVTVHARGEVRSLYRFLASIFFIYGLLLACRMITALISPSQVMLPAATMENILFFPAAMLLDIGLTFAFLMMNDRRLSMELGNAEERLRLTLEATNDGVWDWDIPTGGMLFSASYYRMLGFEPHEFSGSYDSWRALIHPDDVERAERAINGHIHQGIGYAVEIRMRTKSGDWRWILSRGMVVERDAENHPIRMVGAHSDITERKQAEAEKTELESQNRQLQKAESLSRMAGAIAHHFNNQLGAVIGNLEMAMMELSREAGPHAKITAAMKASERAAEISGLMLTYLGQSYDECEPLDLSDACRRILPALRAAMPGDMVLKIDLPSPGPTISTSLNYIKQILTNLITNAWESFGGGRGSVHLAVKTVAAADIPAAHRFPLDWRPQDNAYACLEVADTSSGIEGEDIEKLFDPFFTSKFTGRGLGLPVVLGIARVHGGVVTVESEPERGSAFRVFFPIFAEEADKAALGRDPSRPSG
jgi:PAS domain S-box-containing protein